jgi:hypothetical protein
LSRLPLVSFCVLVAATVAAFFITQHLKITSPLLTGYRATPAVINPVDGVSCGGVNHRVTQISFYLLHRSDTVDVYVIDHSGQNVATLATSRFMQGGANPLRGYFTWNGREDDGRIAPDGFYYVKVSLEAQGRTIVISNPSGPIPLRIKSRPPTPRIVSVEPHLIAAPASVAIHYTDSGIQVATVRIYRTDLPGAPRVVKSFLARGGSAGWDGRIDKLPAPAGIYLVGADATDSACNTGHYPVAFPVVPGETPGAGVTVRYLAAEPPISPVSAASRATVLVDSRHQAYGWLLRRFGSSRGAASGTARGNALAFRAPKTQGIYELDLAWGSHAAAVPLVVSRSVGQSTLVVLPALTWWGLDPGDEDHDGVPDTLSGGASVQLARPLVGGMPGGIGDEVGLLSYLDSIHQSYELSTDFALGHGIANPLTGHRLVILAGDEEWVTPQLGSWLRSYIENGGHVLSLGIGSLLRTVTVSGTQATNPSQPTGTDVLGAQPNAVITGSAQLIAVIRDGLGIFANTSGLFKGFSSYQPFGPLAAPGKLESEAGATSTAPAIIGYRLGRGIVEDIGLPGLGSMLARDADAQQLVLQALSVLGR